MSQTPSTLAVVFADIGGSTRLYDTLGDQEARRIVAACVEQIMDATRASGGVVIKTIGDEVMCTFPDPNRAVDAAVSMLGAGSGETPDGVGVHVGMHLGPVVREKDDVFGDTVNVAARMVALARDGEILTTHEVVDGLSPDRRAMTRQLDRRSVKGKDEKIEIWSVVAPSDGKLTALNFAFCDDAAADAESSVTLQLGAVTLTLDASHPRATIGRQAGADLVLDDVGVSRQHAVVELRHGKFYLCDASTNGTVLCIAGQPPTRLRREEAILHGSGCFGLSRQPEPTPPTPIRFEVRSAQAAEPSLEPGRR